MSEARFLDVETNPGQRRPVPDVCRILFSNVRGLTENLSDLTVALSQYDILLCSEALVSDMRHVSELLGPDALRKLLKCEGGAGAEGAILPYVGHLQLISTLKIGAYCCQLCQYKLTKPNQT